LIFDVGNPARCSLQYLLISKEYIISIPNFRKHAMWIPEENSLAIKIKKSKE